MDYFSNYQDVACILDHKKKKKKIPGVLEVAIRSYGGIQYIYVHTLCLFLPSEWLKGYWKQNVSAEVIDLFCCVDLMLKRNDTLKYLLL